MEALPFLRVRMINGMNIVRDLRCRVFLGLALLSVLFFGATGQAAPKKWSLNTEGAPAASEKILAQRLVDDLAKAHPELVRIGVHVTPPDKPDNIIIASNLAVKIGQKSDPEDLEVMKTGRPVVLKEGDNYDVTLPLHDAAGRLIGALGLTLKPNGAGQSQIVRSAQAITRAFEKGIPSKTALFKP